ncbi:MAG: methyltransferase domain-containing protein [Chloroflexi bacterium]|nr:methyltransferase domain-containing protein [Chloroflexota bacterium]
MMKRFLQWMLIGAAVSFAGALLWRMMSRRRSLPCPAWLSGLLENPFVETVAGGRLVLEHAHIEPGMRVLDVGCGPGRLTVPAARQVGSEGEVVALDIQTKMLDRARAKVAEAGMNNVRFVHAGIGEGAAGESAAGESALVKSALSADAGSATLKAQTYDRALLVTVLGEIPHRERALAEIFHVLKPGGVLSVTELLPDPHYQSYGAVKSLMSQAGFEPLDYHGTPVAFTANFVKPEYVLSVAPPVG